jgi:hypothetical protein
MTTFSVGQEVECKAGIGKITYFEDGFMEVTLGSGIEKDYWAPFDGKVWPYVKPIPVSELPVWDDIVNDPAVASNIEDAKWYHAMTSRIVEGFGGSAGGWDELSGYQKVHFLSVRTGIPVSVLKEARECGKLDEIFQPRTRNEGKAR